jgi:hypothetical protein
MKAKHAVLIFVIGFSLCIIGALMKIMHWPAANLIVSVGSMIEFIGTILIFYKLWTYPKFKEFLNW